jgi:flagellar assembly factor FliW
MMQVRTNRLGHEETIEVSDDQVFTFSPPLGGFEALERFALIVDEESPVEWLQSLDDPEVAFALLEPFLFEPDYAFELPDADAAELGMEGPEDAFVRCVLTLREDPDEITANMVAPLVFSPGSQLVRQIILQDSGHPLRRPILSSIALAA